MAGFTSSKRHGSIFLVHMLNLVQQVQLSFLSSELKAQECVEGLTEGSLI
jgi:hypothetical protein